MIDLPDFELERRVDFPCPFCKGNVTIGIIKVDTGPLLAGSDVVTHALPMCKMYEQYDPAEFLEAARSVELGKRGENN